MALTLANGNGVVFIGGAPRSGTTLMQRIMGCHSEVFAGPEFDFAPTHITRLRDDMRRSIQSGRISKIVDEETLDKAFQSFLCSMFSERLKRNQKSVFCEKTPANALAFEQIGKILPEARFMMMVRDPRDIVNSMKSVRDRFVASGKRPPRFVRSVAASVEEINRFYEAGLAAAKNDSRVLPVYYEDLVEEPEQEVRRICDHVGLAFQQQMVELDSKSYQAPRAETNSAWYSKAQLEQPIQKGGVVAGKFLLTKREVTLVERFMIDNPTLSRYGLRPGSPSLYERLSWALSLCGKAGVFLPRRRSA